MLSPNSGHKDFATCGVNLWKVPMKNLILVERRVEEGKLGGGIEKDSNPCLKENCVCRGGNRCCPPDNRYCPTEANTEFHSSREGRIDNNTSRKVLSSGKSWGEYAKVRSAARDEKAATVRSAFAEATEQKKKKVQVRGRRAAARQRTFQHALTNRGGIP